MTITDTVQQVIDAWSTIVNADTELVSLFARAGNLTPLMIPDESLHLDAALPVLTYQMTNEGFNEQGQRFLDLQVSCFAVLQSTANTAVARIQQLMNTTGTIYNLFAAQSLEVCPNPARRPNRMWPGAQAETADDAQMRADVLLSFLIPG